MKRSLAVTTTASLLLVSATGFGLLAQQPQGQPTAQQLAQQAVTRQDHQRLMELFQITSLRLSRRQKYRGAECRELR
jgi:hypothetical protein